MASGEPVSRIWTFQTDTGELRVHVEGTSADLDRAGLRLQREAPIHTNPKTLLTWLSDVLAEEGITLAERLDVPVPDQPRDLANRIRQIQHLTDASKAFKYLLALFEVSGNSEIEHLITSADLMWVRSYIESVVADLDENADGALQQLRSALDPEAAYILLPR
jgi:hypothetical protein